MVLQFEKIKVHAIPRPSRAQTTNDWCIIVHVALTSEITLPVITKYAIFTIRPKCQQRTGILAECEVSLYRFLLMHRLFCWSDSHILCGNLIEFDGKKCLFSRSFRFYKHFDDRETSFINSGAETPGAF